MNDSFFTIDVIFGEILLLVTGVIIAGIGFHIYQFTVFSIGYALILFSSIALARNYEDWRWEKNLRRKYATRLRKRIAKIDSNYGGKK